MNLLASFAMSTRLFARPRDGLLRGLRPARGHQAGIGPCPPPGAGRPGRGEGQTPGRFPPKTSLRIVFGPGRPVQLYRRQRYIATGPAPAGFQVVGLLTVLARNRLRS